MGVLVSEYRVVRDAFPERSEGRHLNVIGGGRVESLVAAVAEIGSDTSEERFGVGDAFRHRCVSVSWRSAAVNLGGIEHAIATREQQTRASGAYIAAIVLG